MRQLPLVLSLVAALFALATPQSGAARLVGLWTFDNYAGTDPLANKVQDVRWSPLSLRGSGARAADGRLILPRYQSAGVWKQASADTMLRTDFGPEGYFTELTQVVWIKWPGFDPASGWQRVMTLSKFDNSTYFIYNSAVVKGYEGITYAASTDNNWLINRSFETSGGSVGGNWVYHHGQDPPTDRVIKVAHTLSYFDETRYVSKFYVDYADGNGLIELPGTGTVWNDFLNFWGQAGSDSVTYPAGGPRFDGIGLMDYSWQLQQSSGQIEFEEVRLYSGALSAAEIASLNPYEYTADYIERGQWWDELPRGLNTNDVPTGLDYHANISMNNGVQDPGWGLWFSYISASPDRINAFAAAGIRSLGYCEAYGTTYDPISEIAYGQPSALLHHHWNWQAYGGGTIKWAGAWNWFDDADFCRPYTRTHPVYGGLPMRYPDGSVATGFKDDDPTDPRKSRVYEASCAMNVLGALRPAYGYNSVVNDNGGPFDGLIYVPETGKYAGFMGFGKDTACPYWVDYCYASTRMMVAEFGQHGAWTDNPSMFDSFGFTPVDRAFGLWSVARFRTYLQEHFTESQLKSWGVIGANGTYADLATFDVRTYFRTLASSKYGWDGVSLSHSAWKNSGWISEPVWKAYLIFKRQVGTQALADYYAAAKQGAAMGGVSDYLFMGNDPALCTLGWMRGSMDMASTELSLGWHPSAGSGGFGLPPRCRLSPTYKATREQARSRFVNIWLYKDGYEDQLVLDPVINVLYYEMLATNTMPKYYPGVSSYSYAGNPAADKALFQFVKEQATPEFGGRTPVEEIGVYASTSSILSQYTPGGILNFDSQPHHFAVWGWGTALAELHYQYRIVPEWKLTRDLLRTLKVLIIPHSTVFDPADVTVLDSWVREDGGILIVTGDSGSRLPESSNFDTTSSLVLGPLTGVSNWASAPTSRTQVLGNGRVRFLRTNIGLNYFLASASVRASQLSTFASEMSGVLTAQGEHPVVVSSDAPKTVGLTLYEDPDACKLMLDVNNFNVSIAADGKSATVTPTPVINVTIYKPDWWESVANEGVIAYGISPSGSVTLAQPAVHSDRIVLQVPSATYYVSVIVKPRAGVGFAKTLVPGTRVALDPQVVTAVFDDCVYVESPDRSSGVRVHWQGNPVSAGKAVAVAGTVGVTADGEVCIEAQSLTEMGEGTVEPFILTNRDLGGGDFHYTAGTPPSGQRGVLRGTGLNNIGLLVKVQGTVTGVGPGFFCLSDGSDVIDSSGFGGVRVQCGSLRLPEVGAFAVVTGISTLHGADGAAYRCIRPRTQADIEVPVKSRLIALWDFEGANPLANKVAGVDWDNLTLIGTGAGVSSGALVLPRYQSGSTWYQSSATTMLRTDLGQHGYFSEMTQVAWVYWPGFAANHYGRVLGLFKFGDPAYSTSGAKAGQALLWGSYSNQKWRAYDVWEYWSGSSVLTGSRYYDFGVQQNPPTDRYIKLALVTQRQDAGTYLRTLYCDTGSGSVPIGNQLLVPASEVNAFGQYGSDCLIDASGGPRYDGFGVMDVTYRVPTTPGVAYFDEIRVYAGPLSKSELDAL